jgi:hypothetical protein
MKTFWWITKNFFLIGATIAIAVLSSEKLYCWLALPYIVIFVTVISDRFHFYTSSQKRLIHTVLECLCDNLSLPVEHDVRCTLLVPNRRKKVLKQIERYSVSGERSTGTTVKIEQGVAGLCYRERKEFLVVIPQDSNFEDYMVEHWGFNRDEARKFKDRGSYLCTPVLVKPNEESNVLGVISLDSNSTETFAKDKVMNIIEHYVPIIRKSLKGK